MSRFGIGIITIYDDCLAIRISSTFKIFLCINDQSRTTDHTGKACDLVFIDQITIYIGGIRFFGRGQLLIAINQLLAEQSSSKSSFVYTGGQLNWPVPSRAPSSSSLSSGYVTRDRPIGNGSEFHTGYDIPASYGSAVVAAEAGTVIYAGWMSGYGNTVMINHGGGLVTLYGHNSSLTFSKGDTVTRGQQVAKIGSTGNSTGNHCHFEVRVNGSHTSPEPYLGVPNIGY